MTSYGSRPEDWGLASSGEFADMKKTARERITERVAQGMAPAAIDEAISAGQITPNGTVILSGYIRPIRMGRKKNVESVVVDHAREDRQAEPEVEPDA